MPTSDAKPLLEKAIAGLDRAQLKPGWPKQYKLAEAMANDQYLLASLLFGTVAKAILSR